MKILDFYLLSPCKWQVHGSLIKVNPTDTINDLVGATRLPCIHDDLHHHDSWKFVEGDVFGINI